MRRTTTIRAARQERIQRRRRRGATMSAAKKSWASSSSSKKPPASTSTGCSVTTRYSARPGCPGASSRGGGSSSGSKGTPPGKRGRSATRPVQPRLEHHRGRHFVDHATARLRLHLQLDEGTFGRHGREPLVEHLDGDAEGGVEGGGVLPGGRRRRAFVTRERQGEPDHDAL